MSKFGKILLCVGVMTLALTAQPGGKDRDVRNKSSGTEVVKSDVKNVELAVAPVVIDQPAIESFVASGWQDVQYAVYIVPNEKASDAINGTPIKPDKPERSSYLAQLTEFKIPAMKWKDIHRRSKDNKYFS